MKKKQMILNLNGYITYIRLISSVFKFTDKECEVLANLLEYSSTKLNATSRKYASRKLNISKHALNNHIKNIKDKGALIKGEGDNYSFHPLLIIDDDQEQLIIMINGRKKAV
tara:strand:- start:1438 stop:1773 length:336 start_codon:yes stop_codon:yes gene_type:complete